MSRIRQPELMDEPDADPVELAKSLRDLEAVNRWLGGRRAVVRRALDIIRRVPWGPVTILDVATGGADLPLALAAEARRRGFALRIIATDIHPQTLAFATEATSGEAWIEVRRANALDLPFADDAVDVATCCTTLHHFSDEEAVTVLSELNRVSRFGVVLTDLARSPAAIAGAEFLSRTAWRDHPITRHDGPASVRAAFTVPELRRLARLAGMEGRVRVMRDPVFRLTLVADRTFRPAPAATSAATERRGLLRWRQRGFPGGAPA